MTISHYKRLDHLPPPSDSVEVPGGGWFHRAWTKESKADYISNNLVPVYESPQEVE